MTGDLATGEGIEAAAEGAEIIVHCAGSGKGDEDKAVNLVRAASRAGTRHLVYISVVGADRIPVVSGVDRAMFGYFGSKLGPERAVADSGLQWTTLRATQFHDLSLTTARRMARLHVIPVTAHRLPARSDSWSKEKPPRRAASQYLKCDLPYGFRTRLSTNEDAGSRSRFAAGSKIRPPRPGPGSELGRQRSRRLAQSTPCSDRFADTPGTRFRGIGRRRGRSSRSAAQRP
jgi:hypothetical protein